MFRLWLVIGVLAAVFYVYSVVSVALADRLDVRGLPKAVWIVVVVVFPIIGAVLWYSVGRVDGGARRRTVAPDDDADFLASLGENHKKPGDGPNA
ncbi:MAG TPA: PLDc N-terminal domain-containing protein [Gryllotalpicola sp.]